MAERESEKGLREVRLRLWEDKGFQKALYDSNHEKLERELLAILRPLTGMFRSAACPRSEQREEIIRDTIRLWSYLQSLGGKLEIILPERGDMFDFRVHEACDVDSHLTTKLYKAHGKAIFLVKRPGVRWYIDKDGAGEAVLVVKPKVFLRL
jgi:hypothetical protein